MSDLIRIKPIWHLDGIPDFFFEKVIFHFDGIPEKPLEFEKFIWKNKQKNTPIPTKSNAKEQPLILAGNLFWNSRSILSVHILLNVFQTKLLSHNTFKRNGISHFYHLDRSISVLRVVGWYLSFYLNLIEHKYVSKQWRVRSEATFCGVWSVSALFVFAQ